MAKQRLRNDLPLNPQEKKFVRHIVQGEQTGNAALRAGYAYGSYGSFLKTQEKVQTAIKLALEKAGATDKLAARRIKEGMSAKMPEIRYKDGNVKQKSSPDHFNRRGYIDIYMKATGGYAPEKHEVQEKIVHINVNIDMAKGLLDAGKISKAEYEEIQHEPIKENDNNREASESELLDT